MHFKVVLPVLAALPSIFAQTTTPPTYKLRADLKPGQPGRPDKTAYDGLYLSSYHTGAGLNDAVFYSKDPADGIVGSLNGTFPWSMLMALNTATYAAWEPVRIDAGEGGISARGWGNGFFINDTGLQWSSSTSEETNSFAGWMVCDWHSEVQLFFRLKYYNPTTPASCADVYLCPEYQ
ncbi:hypothetical protein B0A48_09723 [Cryoendolithus antarcticus]|uniref:DUF7907 domain-containing protein n=1 Tax=Cryoendolithus antarcticus TaxID=1507870 RepID=A0A1V8T2Z3_9PEZI|nr:hypothetical protein B0A48_09723 [Cryoendolithus antarcticus]